MHSRMSRLTDAQLPPRSLEEAVYRTVLYADIFDFPLTRREVFTFLVTAEGSRRAVEMALDSVLRYGLIETDGIYVYLPGRRGLARIRQRRAAIAWESWRAAKHYARLIWAIPFVRMVAITGALAVHNVERGDDIDFMVVTDRGRLWMTRGMIVLLGKLAQLRGVRLCPNYLVTTQALQLPSHDLYAAHELAQMAVMHGEAVGNRLWDENRWYLKELPNVRHTGTTTDHLPLLLVAVKRGMEAVLRRPFADAIERWERERKITKLQRQDRIASEMQFTADVCKGHLDGHGNRVMRAFARRVARSLELFEEEGVSAARRPAV